MKELSTIQAKLKAPKSNYNKHGKFKYRSAEDILEAVKPLLAGCCLTLNDEVVFVHDSMYVKSTATITNGEGAQMSASAFAKEERTNKMMSDPQRTGSTASYARKYALNGLFAIDDNQDADTQEPPEKPTYTAPPIQQDEYRGLIQKCKSLKELQELWGKIPADMRKQLEAVKDEQKGKLS